ncbi:FAD dependent oxidoreductase [Suillus decipiens]|nr:FAD dependent oxidoreductase [Suillus decipiens]
MSTTKAEQSLIVLGAGVVGLTIAYLAALADDVSFDIKVIARDLPEDTDFSQAWSSPYGGANWSPMELGGENERVRKWEEKTFNKLWDMIPTGLVKLLPTRLYTAQSRDDKVSDLWWKDLVRNIRVLPPSDIPEPFKAGVAFDTVSVNPSEYLPWLQSELISRGVTFERRNVASLDELRSLVGPDGMLVNASALGSRSIIGVQDTKLYPIRGQTILVHAPGLQECLLVYSATEEATYIIPRPGKGQPDTAILGGTFQPGNWDTSLDMQIARGIFDRCAALAPCLKSAESRILKYYVGLRPERKGGPRVELEQIALPLQSTDGLIPWNGSPTSDRDGEQSMLVVHAYGFGPGGFQRSWGAAEEVLELVKAQVALKHNT